VRNKVISIGAILCGVAVLAVVVEARTITVAMDGIGDCNNIQAAINSAVNGDMVLIKDGVYMGPGNRDIEFKTKQITVRSENGPEHCILDCQGNRSEPHRGFHFWNTPRTGVLEGVSIIHGAALSGGGIKCEGSPTIRNCVISDNIAFGAYYEEHGGDGMISTGNPKLEGCIFRNNAIWCSKGNSDFYGCSFEGDYVGISSNDYVTIVHCFFREKEPDENSSGCAIGIHSGGLVDGCTIITEGSGIIVLGTGDSTIRNNLILGTMDPYGAGVLYDGGAPYVIGNTITNFRYGIWFESTYNEDLRKARIKYNDIYSNTFNYYFSTQNQEFDLTGLNGNISDDPMFFSAADRDYHLMPGSPCINAGDPAFSPSQGAVDLDGDPRVLGGRVDIGPDEYKEQGELIAIEIGGPEVLRQLSRTQYDIIARYDDGTSRKVAHLLCNWDMESGQDETLDSGMIVVGPVSADHEVTLHASYAEKGKTAEAAMVVDVIAPRELHFPEIYPTILDAVHAAWDGDTIVLADGEYRGFGNRDIEIRGKCISFRSENGPEHCRVDAIGGDSPTLSFLDIETGTPRIEGITFIHGNLYFNKTNPIIVDCAVRNSSNIEGYPFVIQAKDSSPLIRNCSISDNGLSGCIGFFGSNNVRIYDTVITGNHSSDAGGISCYDGVTITIERCKITNNWSSVVGGISVSGFARIRDCLIEGNVCDGSWYTYPGPGGILCSGEAMIENCLITGNSSYRYTGNGNGGYGGGIACTDGILSLRNNLISGNRAEFIGGGVYVVGGAVSMQNCIVWDNTAKYNGQQIAGEGLVADANVAYCNIEGGRTGIYDPNNMTNWGEGNIDHDPLFAKPGYWNFNKPQNKWDDVFVPGDYHLKSQYGRWDAAAGVWVKDAVTSPCIDAGDPADMGWMNELWPNGRRIDIGAYGGTAEASLSGHAIGTAADLNFDDRVDIGDFAILARGWMKDEPLLASDLTRDGRVGIEDLAAMAEEWMR
jgi:hypothetical protein